MRLAIPLLLVVALAGCQSPSTHEPAADPVIATAAQIETGHILAQAHCAACHAIGPTGKSPMRAAPPFRSLSQRYPIDDLAESLAEGIVTGHPNMPEWVLTQEEITELLGYMDSIQVKTSHRS